MQVQTNSNARSTKTRIETPTPSFLSPISQPIRMQDPLKQGLKLSRWVVFILLAPIRMQDPLKQGLKQSSCCAVITSGVIRMQDPLKQGLKRLFFSSLKNIFNLFECKIH